MKQNGRDFVEGEIDCRLSRSRPEQTYGICADIIRVPSWYLPTDGRNDQRGGRRRGDNIACRKHDIRLRDNPFDRLAAKLIIGDGGDGVDVSRGFPKSPKQ